LGGKSRQKGGFFSSKISKKSGKKSGKNLTKKVVNNNVSNNETKTFALSGLKLSSKWGLLYSDFDERTTVMVKRAIITCKQGY